MTIEGSYHRPWTAVFWYNLLQLPLSMTGLAVLLLVPFPWWTVACTSILAVQIVLIVLAYRRCCPRITRNPPLVYELADDVNFLSGTVVPAGMVVTADGRIRIDER
jgi:hypothetical protein